jgi:hypothetical protein
MFNADPEARLLMLVPCANPDEFTLPAQSVNIIGYGSIQALEMLDATQVLDVSLLIAEDIVPSMSRSSTPSQETTEEPYSESKKLAACLTLAEIKERLQTARLPYEVGQQEQVTVLGSFVITPPYTRESCDCSNVILLTRIQKCLALV